jgi:hypothetical protein
MARGSKRCATCATTKVFHLSQTREIIVTDTTTNKTDDAAAMKNGKKPGPKDSPVQVRNAGEEAQADKPENWDEHDEAVDESFPASDSSAKY